MKIKKIVVEDDIPIEDEGILKENDLPDEDPLLKVDIDETQE